MDKSGGGPEEAKILSEVEEKYGVPQGFLIEIINLEKQHLFQLKRRNVIKKMEKVISDFAGE